MMNKFFSLAFVALAFSFTTYAQDDLSQVRDLSKFAHNTYVDNDQYCTDSVYETVVPRQAKGRKIKNVIVMIGDGMGFEQVSCGLVLNGGSLNMTNCPYTGASRTYATDKLITDSCAGGTALGTGVKTKYGYIACNPDGQPVQTVLEYAQELGKRTGIIVSCRINDATPADFSCHSLSRGEEEAIAAQYADNGIDFVVGGGFARMCNREDGRNIVAEMQSKGYSYVSTKEDLASAESLPLLGLYGNLEMDLARNRGDLVQVATAKALDLLSRNNRKGFVLMIEGSDIDHYCHSHETWKMSEELLDFDRTVGEVLKWAEKDGETLVVITADHATGGLTLLAGDREERSIKVNYSTWGHNGILVPVFAYGPHADVFVGVHENNEVGALIRSFVK